jgi:hypothetical protein
VLAKNNKAACTDPHISILGHITEDELKRLLTTNDAGNGFANRFLWVLARRSKCLPFGGSAQEQHLRDISDRARIAIEFARGVEQVDLAPEAREISAAVYPELSADKPGLAGAVTGRAEAQTVRLATLYALLDRSELIRGEHIRAALAAWQYCEDSAYVIFGDSLGDPTADEILRLLRANPDGISRTAISDHFHRNKKGAELIGHWKYFGQKRSSKQKRGRPAADARKSGLQPGGLSMGNNEDPRTAQAVDGRSDFFREFRLFRNSGSIR